MEIMHNKQIAKLYNYNFITCNNLTIYMDTLKNRRKDVFPKIVSLL